MFAPMSATVPPNIKGEEVNATVMLGHQVELHCQSDAIPPPTLTWRKDGRPLFRKPGLTVSADGSVLKVRQVAGLGHTCGGLLKKDSSIHLKIRVLVKCPWCDLRWVSLNIRSTALRCRILADTPVKLPMLLARRKRTTTSTSGVS